MKYTAPIYENVAVDTIDVICASATVTTYQDKDNNTVEEHNYSFSDIFSKF